MADTAQAPILVPPGLTVEDAVDQYVRLRDTLKKADDAHKKKLQAARDYLEMLNAYLLLQLSLIGGEGVKTKAGTVYRTERKTASISDGKVFQEYVIGQAQFDLIDWKANSSAVADHITQKGTLPPGVTYNVTHLVGVRRA